MNTPTVSVIVPCRNERAFIADCIYSVVTDGYPHNDMEILVIDGMSTDGTRGVLEKLKLLYPFLGVLDNPARSTPVGLNLGIRAARGRVIVRIDAHSTICCNYIGKCADAVLSGRADNAGGSMLTVPQNDSLFGAAVVACLSHVFGVGGSRFRTGAKKPLLVDTVFGGCFRRSLFDEIGFFNEKLSRGQDMEFNRRLEKRGKRILLLPDVVSVYHARSTVGMFLGHNWTNGVWAILPFLYSHVTPVSLRHLIPLLFALSVSVAVVLAAARPAVGLWFLAAIMVPYAVVCLAAAVEIAVRRRKPLLLPLVPFVFLGLHLSYGFGSCWGLLRAARTLASGRFHISTSSQVAVAQNAEGRP
ncbi:MAG: glycosyltransferase family 2 protein [Acidobacteriota bacterium]